MMDTDVKDLFCGADPAVSIRRVRDEGAVLYHPDTGKEKFINNTGFFIWRHLDGTRSAEDIAEALTADFEDVPREQVYTDVAEF